MAQPLILVVEDEPILRMSATAILEDAGFDTLDAASADEAIVHLEANPLIQIVFTDIDMPGSMDGLRLAGAIRSRWPPIDLVLTSGHVLVAEQDIPARGQFLPKPYDAGQLTRMMHSFGHP
jgi:CheY-like chemotaxis protein